MGLPAAEMGSHWVGGFYPLGGGLPLGPGKAGPETRFRESRGPGSHRGAGPAIRPQECQCHFLPSTLEKTNGLNRLHMQLWGAEGGSTGALLVKENIPQHCCRDCSPNYRACVGSPLGNHPGISFLHEDKVPEAPIPGWETLESSSLRLPFAHLAKQAWDRAWRAWASVSV